VHKVFTCTLTTMWFSESTQSLACVPKGS